MLPSLDLLLHLQYNTILLLEIDDSHEKKEAKPGTLLSNKISFSVLGEMSLVFVMHNVQLIINN